MAATEAALGPLTLLVNNAGFTDAGNLVGLSLDSWRREIGINLDGPYHCLRAVLPRMAAQGAGAVVNIASVNGVRFFGNPAYSAAKAGVINLTQAVASEYGRHGIRCNAVLPGSVRTPTAPGRSGWRRTHRFLTSSAVVSARPRRRTRGHGQGGVLLRLGHAAASPRHLPVDGGLLAGINVMMELILELKD